MLTRSHRSRHKGSKFTRACPSATIPTRKVYSYPAPAPSMPEARLQHRPSFKFARFLRLFISTTEPRTAEHRLSFQAGVQGTASSRKPASVRKLSPDPNEHAYLLLSCLARVAKHMQAPSRLSACKLLARLRRSLGRPRVGNSPCTSPTLRARQRTAPVRQVLGK